MKILLVSLARRGGMLHFLIQTANALVHLVPTGALVARDADTRLLESSVRRFRLETGRGLTGMVRALSPVSWVTLWRDLGLSRPTVVHIIGVHEWNPVVAIMARMRSLPLVYTVHDPQPHQGAPLAIRASDWMTTRLANELIVLTKAGKNQLVNRGVSAEHVHVIPHGLYTILAPPRTSQRGARRTILYFGRFEPYKGMDVLITAFRQIRRLLPRWRLVLAGSGALPEGLRGGTTSGIEVRHGYVSEAGVGRLMGRASFVVVPYTAASQSGVVATAYACGKPVIASSVGGLKEMVVPGRTGLLVEPNDPEALAKAMLRLAADPARLGRLCKSVRDLAPRRWGWRSIAGKHVRLYSAVARRSQPAP